MKNLSRPVIRFATIVFLLANLFPAFSSGQAVSLITSSTRFAGTGTAGFTGDFGSDTTIGLNQPSYVVLDSLGNQYVSDTSNNCVRKIDPAGNLTTLAGLVISGQGDTCNTAGNSTPVTTAGLLRPTGLALDASNNLYIADSGHNCVRRLLNGTTGTANLLPVAGTCGSSTLLSATPNPNGLLIDSATNLYVSIQDTEILPVTSVYQVIRQSVVPTSTFAANTATLCVVAGTPSVNAPLSCSGIANTIGLSAPSGLALDPLGGVYVADTGNNCVRRIVGGAAQTTVVGLCANDNTGTSATALHNPYGLAFSRIGNMFISEVGPDNIYRFTPSIGLFVRMVGLANGAAGNYTSQQDGAPALNIPLNSPRGIAFDANNNFYVVDSANNIVRFFNLGYVFPPIAVNNSSAAQAITFVINTSSNLSATVGPDYRITSISCFGTLNPAPAGSNPNTCQVFVQFAPSRPGIRYSALTITDSVSGGIVSIGLQGVGVGPQGVFSPGIVNTIASNLSKPTGIATDSGGNAYILEGGNAAGLADVRVVTPNGTSSVVIKNNVGLVNPSGIATDAAGNWYIADRQQGSVARFGADGSINLNYATGLISPSAIYVDGFSNLYVAQQGTAHNVIEIFGSGQRRIVAGSGVDTEPNNVPAANALFNTPAGLFIDLNGVLYISDTGAHRVFAINTDGLIHVVAGTGTTTSTNTKTALGTAIVSPSSVAVDAAGDVYVADSAANRVYVIYATSASGVNIATVLGTGVAGNSGDGGYSVLAKVSGPLSVALDGSGNLFVVDSGNNSVRQITYPTPTLNFGNITVGNTSPALIQNFGNTGNVSLNLISVLGTNDPHFYVDSATTTCGTSILSGEICGIGYKFVPTAAVNYVAAAPLSSTSYNSPEVIALLGNGTLALPVNQTVATLTETYGNSFQPTTFNPGSGPVVTGTITYSINGTVICTSSGTMSPTSSCNAANTGLSVGTYPVVITYSGDNNYAASTTTTSLVVAPAPLTINNGTPTRIYGQPNPSATGTISGLVNGDTILVSTSTTATQNSPVGSYAVTSTLTPVGGASLSNYTISNNPGTLVITPAPLTATITNVSRLYGQPNPAFASTVTGAVAGDTFITTYSTTATQASPIGTYPIFVTLGGSAIGNYAVSKAPAALTITQAPLSVAVGSATRPYGSTNPSFSSSITGQVNGDTFTDNLTTTATIASAPGNYPITDTVSGAAASNYAISVTPGTLTISRALVSLTVGVGTATRTYGSPNPTFNSVSTGLLNGDIVTVTYTTTATTGSPVGTYTVTPVVSGPAAAFYNVVANPGVLTVTPAPLTVSGGSVTRVYGAPNPALNGTVTGAVNGDTFTSVFSTPATATSAVGKYPVTGTLTAVGGSSLSNYTVVNNAGTFTITPAILTANVTNLTRFYGQPNPPFVTVFTGAASGDTFTTTYTTTATQASAVGAYPISVTLGGTSIVNYTVSIVPGTLTVTPAPLTVTVASATRAYGIVNPTFSTTITGQVNGDVFTDKPTTSATINSAPGSYAITDTVIGTASSNYAITVNPGTLVITRALLPLTVSAANATRVYGAANPTFTSTTTGALNGDTFTVTYTTTATAGSPVGTYTVTPVVSGAAAANYTVVTNNGTLTVTPAPLTVAATSVTRAYGSPNPTLTGTTTGLVNGDTIATSFTTTATQASPIGTYPIVASATGAALSNYTLVTTNSTLTVTPVTISITLAPSSGTRIYGTPNPTFNGVINGAVNGDVLTATIATTATITSPVGTYPITAILAGTNAGNYVPTVIPAVLTVTAAPTVTTVISSNASIAPLTPVTFTATVTSAVTAAVGTPPGSVNFFDGATLLGSGTVTNGVATFTTTSLSVGTHSITAVFVPSTANFLTSSSSTLPQIIFGTFGISATPPTQFIRGAGTTVYNVTVNSVQNFSGPVALTCSGLPVDATCTFSSPTVVLTAGGAVTVQMSVSTTTADAKLQLPTMGNPSAYSPIALAATLPFDLTGFALLFAGTGRRKRLPLTRTKRSLLTFLLFTVGVFALVGCGCPNFAYKTYTINVTGTSIQGTAPTVSTSVLLSVGLSN